MVLLLYWWYNHRETIEKSDIAKKEQELSTLDGRIQSMVNHRSKFISLATAIDHVDKKMRIIEEFKLGYLNSIFDMAIKRFRMLDYKLNLTPLGDNCKQCSVSVVQISQYATLNGYSLAFKYRTDNEQNVFDFIEYVSKLLPGIVVTKRIDISTHIDEIRKTTRSDYQYLIVNIELEWIFLKKK
jgi:hypothetical protein